MPKIPGLKKKKKGKKNKHKEEEEFDAEELAKYRREQQLKEEAAAEASSKQGETSAQSDEWQKFKALTAGVDSILKRTHDDLDRLKETSYFQRKPPGPSEYGSETSKSPPKEKSWTDFEEGQEAEGSEAAGGSGAFAESEAQDLELKFEEYDSDEYEEDSDADEDIFDTTFVDIVRTEDLHLAYIPDSPIEKDDGPDPFDTSIVDTVIRPESEKERKRKLISLGCAVDYLAGKIDKPISPAPEHHESTPRRRPKPIDLLLGSFDENSTKANELENATAVQTFEPSSKTLLDEEVNESLPTTPVDVADTLSILQKINETVQEAKLPQVPEKRSTPVLEKFGIDELIDGEEDEFAALASESLAKSPLKPDRNKPQRPPPLSLNIKSEHGNLDFDSADPEDPFDTSFAERVLPGKCELKLIENEILGKDESELIQTERVKFDGKTIKYSGITIEINNQPVNSKEKDTLCLKKDLLGGSTTDLSHIGSAPIEPTTENSPEDIVFSGEDPFDTSIVQTLTAPGKTELKFLEQEFLSETETHQIKVSEKVVQRPDHFIDSKKHSIPKVVAFIEPPGVNGTEEPSRKPVTPYYPGRSFESETVDFLSAEEDIGVKLHTPVAPRKIVKDLETIDPFDTSIASNIQPSTTELKLIETELLSSAIIEVSDPFEITDLK